MPHDMKGKKQLNRSAVASADAGSLWRILMDSKLLPRWAPVVHDVERCEANGESVGAVRQCRVELAGRAGRMVERCVDIVPERSISYLVDDESFGMRKMFADYGFRVSLEPLNPMETRVTIESFYTPRNAIYAFMNAVMMRPQFRGVVDQLISGLIALAESTGEARPAPRSVPAQ
jgi:uncharacterized protein YndB with AHSA1/START domain